MKFKTLKLFFSGLILASISTASAHMLHAGQCQYPNHGNPPEYCCVPLSPDTATCMGVCDANDMTSCEQFCKKNCPGLDAARCKNDCKNSCYKADPTCG